MTSLAAVASRGVYSNSLQTKVPNWQPDGVGRVAKIGVLTPEFDPVPESEMSAMAPAGVSIHASRVTWNREAKTFAEPPHVDNAVKQLEGLKPRVIVYGFASSSYANGSQADEPLRQRLEKAAGGVPVVLPAVAAVDALRTLNARKLALILPPWFSEQTISYGREYFRSRGFEVVFCAGMTPSRQFTEVSPSEVYDWITTRVPTEAEAVFIGGNGLRAIGAIQAMEKKLRRPVLSANQVAFWRALQIIGLASKVKNYGRIFSVR